MEGRQRWGGRATTWTQAPMHLAVNVRGGGHLPFGLRTRVIGDSDSCLCLNFLQSLYILRVIDEGRQTV